MLHKALNRQDSAPKCFPPRPDKVRGRCRRWFRSGWQEQQTPFRVSWSVAGAPYPPRMPLEEMWVPEDGVVRRLRGVRYLEGFSQTAIMAPTEGSCPPAFRTITAFDRTFSPLMAELVAGTGQEITCDHHEGSGRKPILSWTRPPIGDPLFFTGWDLCSPSTVAHFAVPKHRILLKKEGTQLIAQLQRPLLH